MGDAQGRDNVTTAKMALAEDGKFLGIDVDLMGDMGAYLSTSGRTFRMAARQCCAGLYVDIQAFVPRRAPCSPTPCRSMPMAGRAAPRLPTSSNVWWMLPRANSA